MANLSCKNVWNASNINAVWLSALSKQQHQLVKVCATVTHNAGFSCPFEASIEVIPLCLPTTTEQYLVSSLK